jgi:hypothetical protein
MNKAFTSLLLAGTTALTACGGGGGGGGGSDTFTPINIGGFDISNVEENSFTAVVQDVSADGKATAEDVITVFSWMNQNTNIDTSELSKYTVEVNGTTMTLDVAYNLLKGYKKLYYDGKEQWWANIVNTGQFDDASEEYYYIKEYALMESQGYINHADIGADNNFTTDDFNTNVGIEYNAPNTFDPTPTTQNIGQLGIISGTGEIISALVTMTEDNKLSTQEIVQAFEFVDANPNLDTSDLSNYTITIDGVEKNLVISLVST